MQNNKSRPNCATFSNRTPSDPEIGPDFKPTKKWVRTGSSRWVFNKEKMCHKLVVGGRGLGTGAHFYRCRIPPRFSKIIVNPLPPYVPPPVPY